MEKKIRKLKKLFKDDNLDGYLVPKNDEFFGEYLDESKDRLKFISNFSGTHYFFASGFRLVSRLV